MLNDWDFVGPAYFQENIRTNGDVKVAKVKHDLIKEEVLVKDARG